MVAMVTSSRSQLLFYTTLSLPQVRKAAESIQPGIIAQACGSYRRGKATCGDVDILVTHPDGKSHQGVYGKLIAKLKEESRLHLPTHGTTFSTRSTTLSTHGSTFFCLIFWPRLTSTGILLPVGGKLKKKVLFCPNLDWF